MFSSIRRRIFAAMLTSVRNKHSISKHGLKGKIAVVTGSTQGIGYAIAKRLAQDGAKVIISSRNKAKVDNAVHNLTSEGLDVIGLTCHVAKPEDRKAVFDMASQLGGLDILVSNVAINHIPGPILNINESAWNKLLDVNLTAPLLLSKEAYPYFQKRGGGNIVYISSFVAFQPPVYVGIGAYSITKTALLGLTKTLALEWASENIRVNGVAPGVVNTRFGQFVIQNESFGPIHTAMVPQNRFAEPEEISGLVAFLVSEDAKYITGETICACGGGPSRL